MTKPPSRKEPRTGMEMGKKNPKKQKTLWLQQSLKMIMLHMVLKIFKSQPKQEPCMPWNGFGVYL